MPEQAGDKFYRPERKRESKKYLTSDYHVDNNLILSCSSLLDVISRSLSLKSGVK